MSPVLSRVSTGQGFGSIVSYKRVYLASQGGGGYQISRSLRFNSADSAYLSRTPAGAGNRKTWTWAGWVKRSKLSELQQLFGAGQQTSNDGVYSWLRIDANDKLNFRQWTDGGSLSSQLTSTAVFRDTSAWFHLVFAYDSTQASDANKVKIYINGVQITVFDSADYPGLNDDAQINNTKLHTIGSANDGGSQLYLFNGYLADIHFLDGTAADPSSFAETNAITGQWVPKTYSGSYGTNGFKLNFSSNASTAALGTDTSGNGNTWTVNNFSVTAGSGNDSLVDTPTSYGTDTGVGAEVRGNYATLNPLLPTLTPTNGNLDTPNSSGQNYSTIAVSTGKWYVETTVGPITTETACGLGVHFNPSADTGAGYYNSGAYIGLLYSNDMSRYEGVNSAVSNSVTASSGSILAIRLDLDSGTQTISYYLNNTLITSSNLPSGKTWFITTRQNNNQSLNFGQRAFAYTAPSGFKALVDTNLSAPAIVLSNTAFDTKLYTGNGGTQSITGLAFSPDFVWIKPRSISEQHELYNVISGPNKALFTDFTDAETTVTNGLNTFNSDGFALGSREYVNGSGKSYVAWTWDAGTSTVTNTSGSISAQVRANPSAGFSVVSYTGTGSTGTLGHGLGVKPQFLIVKSRSQARDWIVYHTSYGATQYTTLNGTGAAAATTSAWNNTEPTSTVFTIGNAAEINTNGSTNIAYCFAPVSGYSSMSSFVGNGSSDGPFCFTGFRPRWIILKNASAAAGWYMFDAVRNPYNLTTQIITANTSSAEYTDSDVQIDILSNGFKLRSAGGQCNGSSNVIVYAAFAESPLQYSRAR
jgi:hypothetical protein